jgi:hypothetical protein
VLERSALVLLPALDELERSGLLLEEARLAPEEDEPAELAPVLPPIPELELEPVPVLLPPAAPVVPDSRTSDTITSGATSVGGNVTMATAKPF